MRTSLALFVLLPMLAGAQVDYFANAPIWRVTSVCNQAGIGGGPCITTDDHQFILSGDTLIEGMIYQRTLRYGSISPMWTGPGPAPAGCTTMSSYGPELSTPIRQEGRALFVWNGEADQLLFDFDLEIGDVLPLAFNNSDPNIEVVDLDSVEINGEWRRVYTTSGGTAETIVEGIGSARGLFEPISDIFECGHNFVCFSLNGGPVYPGQECEIIMAVDGLLKQDIDIRFDPARALLTVLLPGGSAAMPAEVLDLNGRACLRTRLTATGGQIDLASLAAGTYLVRIGEHTERVVLARY